MKSSTFKYSTQKKRYIFIISFYKSGLFHRKRKHAKVWEAFQLGAWPHFNQTSSVTSNYSLGIFVH